MIINESDVLKGAFMFISYSHRDKDIVREDVSALMDKGARLWIDHRDESHENMTVGDNWKERVKNAISHKNCCGVIFFVSGHALASRAVQEEQLLAEEYFGEKGMFIVNIGGEAMQRHYATALSLCLDTTSYYHNPEYFFKIAQKQQVFFNDDYISVQRINHADAIAEIENKILRPRSIIDDSAILRYDLSQTTGATMDIGVIGFGRYKDSLYKQPILYEENSRFSSGSSEYIHHNNQIFTTKELKWRLLYEYDSTAVLICCEIIELCSALKIADFLKAFRKMAFNSQENAIVKVARLFRKDDESKINSEDRESLLRLFPNEYITTWWIEDDGLISNSWCLAYKDTHLYGHGFLATLQKGVRPIIEIDSHKLKEYCRGK